jgi:hypothetical protein
MIQNRKYSCTKYISFQNTYFKYDDECHSVVFIFFCHYVAILMSTAHTINLTKSKLQAIHKQLYHENMCSQSASNVALHHVLSKMANNK